jgi:hypothetical protein
MNERELLDRIERLEARARRSRVVVVALALTGVSALALGLTQTSRTGAENIVKATRFVLVDDEGRERAVLGFKGRRVGLFVLPRRTERIPELVFVGSEGVEGATVEDGLVEVRSEIGTPQWSAVRAHSITLHDEEDDHSVGLSCMPKQVALEFRDRSGCPYVSLSHDSVAGTRLSISAPLGIKDAFADEQKAYVKGEKGDPRIARALLNAVRFTLAAPPFDDPSISLSKDGHLIWVAK